MSAAKLPGLLRTVIIIGIAVVAFTAATQKQVHPASGPGGPLVIAVLSDGYTAAQEAKFDQDAKNFIQHSLLADALYFQGRAAEFTIETFFDPLQANQTSNYGFVMDAPNECGLGTAANTESLMDKVVGGINPKHIIIIGNHDYYLGCASGEWVYLANGGVGTDVLLHEAGHMLAKLFDEFSLPHNINTPYPRTIASTDRRNCATNLASPHWSTLSGISNVEGCDWFGKNVIHPFDMCRMGENHSHTFCAVCKSNLDSTFDYVRNPETYNPEMPPAPPTNLRIKPVRFELQPKPTTPTPTPPQPSQPTPTPPRPILRLLAEFNPAARTVTMRSGSYAVGRYVPEYRRFGEYVYEVTDNGAVVAVGVLSRQLFEMRSYQGHAQSHTAVPTPTADIVVQVPGLDAKVMSTSPHALTLVIYQLAPNVTAPVINPSVFEGLKANQRAIVVATARPEQIREVLPP